MKTEIDSREQEENLKKMTILENVAREVVEELHLDPHDFLVMQLRSSADFKSALSVFVRQDELDLNSKDFIAAFKEKMIRVAMKIA